MPFDPPEGYHYVVEDHNRDYMAVWMVHHFPYSYTTEKVRTIWGFVRRRTLEIVSPTNAKTPGKVVSLDQVTRFSALPLLNKPKPSVLNFL